MTAARILVVDDEPDVRDMLSRVLRYRGYEVEVAGDAPAAFDALRGENRFEVVLMDLILGDADGMVLMQEMVSMDPRLRFVVVTAKLLQPQDLAALSDLGVGWISKPFRNDEVIQAIECARRAGEAQPRVSPVHA